MNLASLAAYVCGKINQNEAADVAACEGFLTKRHEMIWNDDLWKDALVEFTQVLSPTGYTTTSTWLPTSGVLLLPTIIQRVVAVRSDTAHMNVQRPEFYYRRDYDSFAKTGRPYEFILLPPCVWQFETAQSLYITPADTTDAGTATLIAALDSDSIGVTRYSLANETPTLDTEVSTTRVDVWTRAQGVGSLTLGIDAGILLTNSSGKTTDFQLGPTTVIADQSVTLADGASATVQEDVYIIASDGAIWTQLIPGGREFRGTIVYNGGGVFTFTGPSSSAVATILAADTNAARRQRIRLIEIPSASMTIRVLGKRICPDFSEDADEPAINGSDNLLLTLTMADMLERERQYGRAQMLKQEAAVLLDQLKRIETVQQAHHVRLIPEDGYGSGDELGLNYGGDALSW